MRGGVENGRDGAASGAGIGKAGRGTTGFALLLAALCLLASLGYWALWPQAPFVRTDTAGYQEVARDLRPDFRLDALHDRTPGYPVLLLLTGAVDSPTRALFAAQLFLHGGAVWLLAALLLRLGVGRGTTGLFALAMWLPPYVEPAAMMLTETLAAFLLAAGVAALARALSGGSLPLALAAGAAFGAAALVRPVYQLVGAAVALFLLAAAARAAWRRRARGEHPAPLVRVALAVGLLGTALPGGLVLHHARAFGFAGLTPLLGLNLCTRTVAVVEQLPDEYRNVRELLVGARDESLVEPNSSHTGVMYVWRIVPQLERATGRRDGALSDYLTRMNLRLIRQEPLQYLLEVGRGLVWYLFPTSGRLAAFGSTTLQLVWGLLQFATLGAAVAVGLLLGGALLSGLVALPRAFAGVPLRVYGVTWLLVGYTALLSAAVDVGNPRYRLPTEPLLLFGLALGGALRRRLVPIGEEASDGAPGEASRSRPPVPGRRDPSPRPELLSGGIPDGGDVHRRAALHPARLSEDPRRDRPHPGEGRRAGLPRRSALGPRPDPAGDAETPAG